MCVYGCISFLLSRSLSLYAGREVGWPCFSNFQFAGMKTKLFFCYSGIPTVVEAWWAK